MFRIDKLTLRLYSLTGLALAMSVGLDNQGFAQETNSLDKVTVALPFPVASYLVPVFGKDMSIFEKRWPFP
ncbi:hypothetical protein [Chelativorans alearense]|uniref:hypothetical protein n=1 Tax=Chelativorans alearense TaxID=2681495 RepID=UPI0013D67C4C|nr:hypothetical protein [Chelativorans alearense]